VVAAHVQVGDCYSGYTGAQYGRCDVRYVSSFGALTHVPKRGKRLRWAPAQTRAFPCFSDATLCYGLSCAC
jgi:hypothetical protein